jgi:alcohol dehydrogenase (cytochrome c)
VFYKDSDLDDEPSAGLQFLEGSAVASGHPRRAGIRALDPMTGRVVWEHVRREPRPDMDRIGGTLATAGNLVFFGDATDLVAADARDGRELWRVNMGGEVIADPVSFAVDGGQRVAIAAGKTLFVFRR